MIPRSPSRLDPLKSPRTREANRRAAEELANRSLRGGELRGEPRKGSQGRHRGGRPGGSNGYIEYTWYTQYINQYTQYTKYTGDFSAAAYSRLGDSAVAWPFEAPHFAEHVLAVPAGQAERGRETHQSRQPHQNREPLLYASALDSGWTAAAVPPDIPADIPWTLEPGITTFTLIRNGRRDSRRIEVR